MRLAPPRGEAVMTPTVRRPLVSVCIPTRNRARFVGDAIASVFAQTLQDFEIVVFDDASTDETATLVRRFDDGRVRYFRQPRQAGIPANRNSCLAMARGSYIAWLDSDDRYLPDMLATQASVLDAHPEVGLVHGGFEVIDEDGRRLPDWSWAFDRDVVEDRQAAFRELVVLNYITAPTVLVRRECHERVGPYACHIGPSSTDWEMWLRLTLEADVAFTARPLAQYRQHGGSITAATYRSGERLQCDRAAVARVLRLHGHRLIAREEVERRAIAALAAKAVLYARDAVARGDWSSAIRMLCRAGQWDVRFARHVATMSESGEGEDELAFHRRSRAALAALHAELAATRFGARLEKLAVTDTKWEGALERIASTVRALVPLDACIATVDKWDPTLLHLARRAGRHFPDLRLLPDGYPRDSQSAIEHLEHVRQEGVSYLVFPSAAFWWLSHYGDFAQYLDCRYQCVWNDDHCAIYDVGDSKRVA